MPRIWLDVWRVFTLVALLALPVSLCAQQTPAPSTNWPMETLKLKDGRTLQGLIQSQREGEIEFIEIVRPPGRPMFGVLHPIARKELDTVTPLPPAERMQLARRFEQFRHRAVVEAGRMESLPIQERERDGRTWRIYQGAWFSLESTADDTTTRRCIVRIEQTFRAYRLIMEPQLTVHRNLQVRLYGSMDEYRTYLRTLGLEISNPAYYSIAQNQIVAASDLSQYAEELAKANASSEATMRDYRQLDVDLPKRLKSLSEQMQRGGFSKEEIKIELQARRAAWASEMQKLERQLSEIRRRNDARFAQVTQDMFRRLSHEAFHAYVENYVFPHKQGELPRWLNEGMAQIFETGQLEADALRVDAPHKTLLERLQEDLRSNAPLPLEKLLRADGRQFVKQHGSLSTDRNYLYAWGLAWYLTFEFDLLHNDRLDRYVAASATGDHVREFEEFVDQPLEKFEPRWREAMLKLKPAK